MTAPNNNAMTPLQAARIRIAKTGDRHTKSQAAWVIYDAYFPWNPWSYDRERKAIISILTAELERVEKIHNSL